MTIGAAVSSALYLAVLAGCVALGAFRLTEGVATGLDRALTAGVVATSQAVGVPLVLSMLGLLARWPVLAGHVLVLLLVEWFTRGRRTGAAAYGGRAQEVHASLNRPGGLVVTGAGTTLTALAVLPTLRGRLPAGTDTRGYHIANLAGWIHEHSLWTIPFQNPGFFTATHPGNGELLGATFVLATRQDHLLYLVNIGFGALAVLAVASIGKALGGRGDMAALGGLTVVAAPIVYSTHANSLLTDVAAASGMLAGLALLLRAGRAERPFVLLAAGLALGLGLGSKYTVLILSVAVAIWAAFRLRRAVLWLAPGFVLLAAPWFVRNLAFTGNPIYPQGVTVAGFEVFPAGESPLGALRTSVVDHLTAGRWEVLERWSRLGAELYGPIAVLVAAGVVTALVRSRRPGGRSAGGVALFAVFAAGIYLVTPWTGGGPEGLDFLMGSNLRYAIPAMLVGVAVASACLPRPVFVAGLVLSLSYNAWRISRGAGFRSDLDLAGTHLAVVSAAVALAIVAALLWSRGLRLPLPAAAGVCVLAVAMLAVFLVRVDGARSPLYLEATISATGAREVLVLGAEDIRSILGDDLDRSIRTLSQHDVREGPGGPAARGGAGAPISDPDELTEALRSAHEDVLVVRKPAVAVPDGWDPPEEEWIRVGGAGQDEVYVRRTLASG